MKLTIYYNVQNGGDGSAYPHFFESEKLAEFDSDFQAEWNGEGWGESCTGEISFESDSDIKCLEEVKTKQDYLKDLEEYKDYGYKEERLRNLNKWIEKLEKI